MLGRRPAAESEIEHERKRWNELVDEWERLDALMRSRTRLGATLDSYLYAADQVEYAAREMRNALRWFDYPDPDLQREARREASRYVKFFRRVINRLRGVVERAKPCVRVVPNQLSPRESLRLPP